MQNSSQIQLGLNGRGARDFFDALVALKLLDRDADGCYAQYARLLRVSRSRPAQPTLVIFWSISMPACTGPGIC